MAQVSYGTITITDTNDIERIYMEYAQSSSNSTAPTTGWSENIPAWEQGKYIWQRTVVKKEGVALSSDSYGEPVCLTGSTGSTGATGRGVSSIVTTYCNYGTGTPAASYSGWSTTVPIYDSTKPNYWIKTVITYTTGTPATDTKIYQDNGITSATATAASAKTQAATADGKADTAIGTANTANTNATNALNIATGINQHFWTISTDYATGVPAGSYITDTAIDTFKSNKTGGNLLTRSDGIWIRNGVNTLTSLTGTALTFYNPTDNQAQLVIGANGTLQSGNYDRGENDTFSAFGTRIDLTQGEIYSPYFRLSQGNQGKAPGAYISGQIEALSGNIGGAEDGNYWDIGDFVNFNNISIGSLIGHGNSMIQLGQSSVWRLSNNRIHSGWYLEDDKYLHFPSFSGTNEYYDYGMHVPESTSQSFIYLRTANTTNNLSSLLTHLNDDIGTTQTPWTYKFYVDGNGNVHAPGFYIGDSTTPIGGGAGTVAERLTQGYGSATQPIYFNSSGVPTNTTYQLNAAGAKGVDTSISAASTSTNLPTSQAVAAFVEGKGYSTTDNKVQTSQANTTKIYLAGTSTAGTSTGTLNFDSNVYLTTTAGTLHATTFEGNLSGTASRATADGDGNTIKTTYLKLSGGNVTGAVTFGSSVSADELTVGDLVVNGSASFTNNLQANTINGVAVGSNPKFTDNNTTYTFANGTNGFTVTPSGGTAQTVTVTPSIANNVTGTGTSGYLAKFSDTNTITNGPALGTGTTKFLREDGTWVVPGGTYSLPTASSSTLGGVKVGSGLSISDGVLSHTDTSSQASSSNSGRTYIQSITLDTYGHVTALSTATETVTNTHNTAYLYAGASNGTANAATTNGNTYLILMDGGNATTRRKVSGSGTVSVASDASGNITITGSAHPTSLKNPNALTVKVYNGTSTSSDTSYDGSASGQSVSVAGTSAITGITASAASGGSTTFTLTKANGGTSTFDVTVTASVATGATTLTDASGDTISKGSATKPVYFSSGIPVEANIYAGGTAVTLNNSSKASSTASFYAPTTGGTTSQVLIGNGTTSAPVWTSISSLVPSSATNATNDSDGNQINTTYIKKSIGTAAGDIIYWSAASTPTRLAKGSNGQVLKLANGVPTWGTDNNDNTWRGIQVDGTDILGTGTNTNKLNLKAGTNISLSNSSGSVTITATDVKVTQTNTTGNADYRLLFSENANDTTSTETARKSTYLKFNPSSGLLKTYGISSASGSTPVIYSDVSSAEIKEADSSLTTSSSDSDWLKALLIALCNKYPGKSGYIFKGTMTPNSVGWYEVHIYSTSYKDSTTGLPQYSFGRFLKYINNYSLFGTASYSYSYRTVDTNTWNPLTTSQAGYVSTAPNDTAKFLRGDATWAQVSSANLSDIRLTWSSSVSTTDWILAHDTTATGTPLFRAMSPANLKTTMSLNNVENKSSATIRGELTSSNVTTALGYTPVNKIGDTMSGGLNITATNSTASFDEGIRLNYSNRNFAGLVIGGAANSTTGITDGAWWIGTSSSSGGGLFRKLTIAHNTGSAAGTYFYATSATQTNPNLRLPTSGTITSGNMDAVNGGTVYTAISNLSGSYVGLTGNEGILGTKVFGSGTSYGSVTNKTTYTQKANINYNATLDALVFSFA